MPAAGPETPPGDASSPGYIRGGGGVGLQPRRVGRAVAALVVAVLVATTAYLFVDASHRDARAALFRNEGVPVKVRVTGCLAIGSGIGMSVEYWQCRGTYNLAGHVYTDVVIGGNRNLLDAGQVVDAVAVPGHPSLVSTADFVSGRAGSGSSYVAPALLAAVTAIVAGVWAALERRWLVARRRPARQSL